MDLIKRKIEKQERGIALVIAIILIGVSLLVSVGVSDIFLKEFSFSVFNQKSSKAFYAADSGIECAIYLDVKGVFTEPLDLGGVGSILSIPDNIFYCLTDDIRDDSRIFAVSEDATYYYYTVEFDLQLDMGFGSKNPCVKVRVKKREDKISGVISAVIESHGFNVGTNSANGASWDADRCSSDDQNREERVLQSS